MWDHLKQLHQPSDGTAKIFSYRTLMNMEMREGEPTDTFISNWQRQLDAAISAGNIIDETSKCEILMSSLPESWITFVSIHSNEKDLNLQTLIAKNKQAELQRKKPKICAILQFCYHHICFYFIGSTSESTFCWFYFHLTHECLYKIVVSIFIFFIIRL